jgi:hypothetical protein
MTHDGLEHGRSAYTPQLSDHGQSTENIRPSEDHRNRYITSGPLRELRHTHEPLRSPSISAHRLDVSESFPYANFQVKDFPQPSRQLSTNPATDVYPQESLKLPLIRTGPAPLSSPLIWNPHFGLSAERESMQNSAFDIPPSLLTQASIERYGEFHHEDAISKPEGWASY